LRRDTLSSKSLSSKCLLFILSLSFPFILIHLYVVRTHPVNNAVLLATAALLAPLFPLTQASKKLLHATGRCRHQILEEEFISNYFGNEKENTHFLF
jgi:hypothetical protein